MWTETYPRSSRSGYEPSVAAAGSTAPLSATRSEGVRAWIAGCAVRAVAALDASLTPFAGTWLLSGWVVM